MVGILILRFTFYVCRISLWVLCFFEKQIVDNDLDTVMYRLRKYEINNYCKMDQIE